MDIKLSTKLANKIKQIERVQEFQLPHQILSISNLQQSGITTWKNRNIIRSSVSSSLFSNGTKMLSNMQYVLLGKKLKIISANGKDLGEFNVQLRQNDSTNEQTISITKSKNTESIKKPVMITSFPMSSKKIFLYISKSGPIRVVNNNQETVMSNNSKIKANIILAHRNKTNMKLSTDNSNIDISQIHREEKMHKINKIDFGSENKALVASNRQTLNNKVPLIANNVVYKRIAESPFPIASCKKLKVNYTNDNCKQICFKIHKKDCIATIEKREDEAIIFSDNALNIVKGYNEDNICLTQENINDAKENANLIYKSNQVLDRKGYKDMTIIPNNNNISSNKRADSMMGHNIVMLSADNDKITHGTNHVNLKNEFRYNLSLNNDMQVDPKLERIVNNFDVNKQFGKKEKNCYKDLYQKDLLDQWNVIEKAINSVKDKDLRDQALKALSNCCIGIKRYVPKRPPQEIKAVHDTQVQTMVFGLIDPKSFVLVNNDIENIQRISQVNVHDILNTQDALLQKDLLFDDDLILEEPDMTAETSFNVDSLVNQICQESSDAQQVKKTLSETHIKSKKILEQLQKDFECIKTYDNNGMLNIHNAVIKNNIFDVRRYLMILKKCKGSIDILTENGMTSLELAIKYDVHSDIVELLLEAGAQPVMPKLMYESALIIAAKQSSELIPMLIKYVSNSKLLDQTDLEGLAPLHYCCKYGNLNGVNILVSAGANINLKDMKSGRTPLFYASDNNHPEVIEKLLCAGAIANIPNFAGHIPPIIINDMRSTSFNYSWRKGVL